MDMLQHFFFTDVMCCAYLLTHVWLFCDLRDCNPPGFSVHGILHARILEWVAMPSSRGSSHQGSSQVSHIAGRWEAHGGDGLGLRRLHEAWIVQPVSGGELELEPATVLLLIALLSVASLRIILTQVMHLLVWQRVLFLCMGLSLIWLWKVRNVVPRLFLTCSWTWGGQLCSPDTVVVEYTPVCLDEGTSWKPGAGRGQVSLTLLTLCLPVTLSVHLKIWSLLHSSHLQTLAHLWPVYHLEPVAFGPFYVLKSQTPQFPSLVTGSSAFPPLLFIQPPRSPFQLHSGSLSPFPAHGLKGSLKSWLKAQHSEN